MICTQRPEVQLCCLKLLHRDNVGFPSWWMWHVLSCTLNFIVFIVSLCCVSFPIRNRNGNISKHVQNTICAYSVFILNSLPYRPKVQLQMLYIIQTKTITSVHGIKWSLGCILAVIVFPSIVRNVNTLNTS